jgi:hypothetical protein
MNILRVVYFTKMLLKEYLLRKEINDFLPGLYPQNALQ